MCFSATASFLAAGITGAIGIMAIARTKEPRELPLAAMPIFFAIHQGIEGLLWLHLPISPMDAVSTLLTDMFLYLAGVFWPVYAPMTVLLVEPSPRRRVLIVLCVVAGVGVAGDLLWWILTSPHAAVIRDGHIVYATDPKHAVGLAYLIPTGLVFALSSHRALIALSALILMGSAVAFGFYWEAFVSVWCFFAALASGIILFHFLSAQRSRLQTISP